MFTLTRQTVKSTFTGALALCCLGAATADAADLRKRLGMGGQRGHAVIGQSLSSGQPGVLEAHVRCKDGNGNWSGVHDLFTICGKGLKRYECTGSGASETCTHTPWGGSD